jgi:micrococcal nuclease
MEWGEQGMALMRTTIAVVLAMMLSNALAGTIPVCSGGDRAARKVTCIVDGDTGWERGVKWRALNVDTPEISQPECVAEERLGLQARDRLRQLMAGGYRIEWTGGRGRYGRELADVILSDGRDAGQVLIEEGLSQPWPNEGNRWCR